MRIVILLRLAVLLKAYVVLKFLKICELYVDTLI